MVPVGKFLFDWSTRIFENVSATAGIGKQLLGVLLGIGDIIRIYRFFGGFCQLFHLYRACLGEFGGLREQVRLLLVGMRQDKSIVIFDLPGAEVDAKDVLDVRPILFPRRELVGILTPRTTENTSSSSR